MIIRDHAVRFCPAGQKYGPRADLGECALSAAVARAQHTSRSGTTSAGTVFELLLVKVPQREEVGHRVMAHQAYGHCLHQDDATGCVCCCPAHHGGPHLYRCASPDCPGLPWPSSSMHIDCVPGRAA